MKRIIVALMLIAAIVIGSYVAIAMMPSSFGSGSGWPSGMWTTESGGFDSGGIGIVSSSTTSLESRAVHPVTTASSGAFTETFQIKVTDLNGTAFAGISTGVYGDDILVGWEANNHDIIVTKNEQTILGRLNHAVNVGDTISVTITSTDGKKANVDVSGIGSVNGIDIFSPTYAVVRIAKATSSPEIGSLVYNSGSDASPSPSASATATATATPSPDANSTGQVSGINHADMQNWYATQYEPPVLSGQSVIYDESGNIIKIVTGKPGEATITPVSGATIEPTIVPTTVPEGNVTAPLNVTTNTTPTITTVATVEPTKSQSPGFGIIVAAIGMLVAIYVVSRKK